MFVGWDVHRASGMDFKSSSSRTGPLCSRLQMPCQQIAALCNPRSYFEVPQDWGLVVSIEARCVAAKSEQLAVLLDRLKFNMRICGIFKIGCVLAPSNSPTDTPQCANVSEEHALSRIGLMVGSRCDTHGLILCCRFLLPVLPSLCVSSLQSSLALSFTGQS